MGRKSESGLSNLNKVLLMPYYLVEKSHEENMSTIYSLRILISAILLHVTALYDQFSSRGLAGSRPTDAYVITVVGSTGGKARSLPCQTWLATLVFVFNILQDVRDKLLNIPVIRVIITHTFAVCSVGRE